MLWFRLGLIAAVVLACTAAWARYKYVYNSWQDCKTLTEQRNREIRRVNAVEQAQHEANERRRKLADLELLNVAKDLQQCILDKPTADALTKYE